MKAKCSHCQLEFAKEALFPCEINGEVHYFCCRGCAGVFKLLNAEGLESFYEKLGGQKLSPKNVLETTDLRIFDTESFYDKYIRQKGDFCEIALILQGIHCIACIWLNEKVLQKQEGIIECSINYTSNKATVVFDPTKIKPSQIISLIRSIGYDALAYDTKIQENLVNKTKRDYYTRLAVGIFCTMNIMWIAVAQYAGYFSGISDSMRNILNTASFLLCTPTLFYSGWHFWRGAYFSLKNRMVSMDLLLISGVSLAYIYSIYASFMKLETYFESITMIITFVLAGKFLEARGKKIASDALDSLNASIPTNVRVIQKETQTRELIAPHLVQVGDRIEVLAGERVVIDGVLQSVFGLVDESALSGESLPIEKQRGDSIHSSSLVLQTPIIYEVVKTFENSLLSHIITLVEDSLKHRPAIQSRANAISRYFSLSVLTVAFFSFFVWDFIVGVGVQQSLVVAISVIVIACPCALALATPIASVVGLGEAFLRKILFKEARFLETMARADTLVLDKTGTITQGKLQVTSVQILQKDLAQEELQALYGMVIQSNHLISKAVVAYLEGHYTGLKPTCFSSFVQKEARGLGARTLEAEYFGGSAAFMQECGVSVAQDLLTGSGSLFCFSKRQGGIVQLLAIFYLQDTLKPYAKECLEALRGMGVEMIILSGDREESVLEVAEKLNVSYALANATPQDKAEYIRELHKEGRIVVMAGDGLNDAIALSQSEVGIAMGGGVDVAIAVSDVVILEDSLEGLLDSFLIARATFGGIKQNLLLSLAYNICSIPLAVLGYVIPLVAALSMSLSSLLVVGNSLRIRQKIKTLESSLIKHRKIFV